MSRTVPLPLSAAMARPGDAAWGPAPVNPPVRVPRRPCDPWAPRRVPAGASASAPIRVTLTDRLDRPTAASWTRLVSTSRGGDVAQLPGWARLRGTVGFDVRYVLVHAGSELVAGAQVLSRRLPLIGSVGYLPYGPVIAERYSGCADVRTALTRTLAELGAQWGMLFIQPPLGAEVISRELLALGFRTSDADIAPGQSLRLDLSADESQLRSGLSKRLRTWTNRWESRGVTVRPGTDADLALLAELVADTGRHQGFAPVSEDYLRTLRLQLGGDAVIFVGELHGVPVAAALFTHCAGALKLRFAGMDRDEAASRCNVPAAVQWEAIRWAKRAGLRWFDFGGIGAAAAEALSCGAGRHEVRGVDRFKAGFGGELYRYPTAVELISSPLLRFCYDRSRRWSAGRRGIERAKQLLRTGRARATD